MDIGTGSGSGRAFRAAAVALVVLPALSGCSHVSQEDMDTRLSELREDMEEGDRRVEERLGTRMDGLEERTAALEADLQALEEEFNVTVERLETALRFNVPVYFGFDQAELRSQHTQVLDRFSRVVERYYPEARITVEGFTDPAGSRAYNQRLGQRRADAVKDYLVSQGLPDAGLRAVSYGEDIPRQVAEGARGPGEEGWQNRRVVLVIDHAGDLPARSTVTQDGDDTNGESGEG